MTYEKFKDVLFKKVVAEAPEDVEITIRTQPKINKTLEGINIVARGDENAGAACGPVHYFDDLYTFYCRGMSMDELTNMILDSCYVKPEGVNSLSVLDEFEEIKDKLVPQLINRDRNSEFLEDTVYRLVQPDFALIYRVVLSHDESGTTSFVVKKSLLNNWDVSESDIYETAMSNMKENDSYSMFSLSEEGIIPFNGDNNFVAVSTKSMLYGAAGIADEELMEELSGIFGGNYFILPSSTHEILALPYEPDKLEMLQAMVLDVNMTSCAWSDWLSDNVYYYDATADAVRIAA